MKQAEDGSTWIELNCGLVQLPPGELRRWTLSPTSSVEVVQYFGSLDGAEEQAIGQHYSPLAAFYSNHLLTFVTSAGLAVIDLRQDCTNRTPPPVHIEDVEGDARHYLPATAVGLPPNVHVLRLSYSAKTYRAPQKALFRYKLDGYDRDWNEAGDGRVAIYTDLPHGSYLFHVIACNDSGLWNDTGASLRVMVQAALYQTKWFLILCLWWHLQSYGRSIRCG